MKKLILVALLGSGFMLGGCTAALVGGGAAAGYYVGKDPRSVGQITDDGIITSKVNAKFVNDSVIKARDINVDTFNNTVYLYGVVDSSAASRRATTLAQSVSGVKKVVNKLKVIK